MEGCRAHPCEEKGVSAELGQGSTAAQSTLTDGTQLLVGTVLNFLLSLII